VRVILVISARNANLVSLRDAFGRSKRGRQYQGEKEIEERMYKQTYCYRYMEVWTADILWLGGRGELVPGSARNNLLTDLTATLLNNPD